MLNMVNLLAVAKGEAFYNLFFGLRLAMIILMCVSALTAIVLVLLQPANSSGIDALGGSSETFFGKNKGRTMEAKLVKLTKVIGIGFFVVALAAKIILTLV